MMQYHVINQEISVNSNHSIKNQNSTMPGSNIQKTVTKLLHLVFGCFFALRDRFMSLIGTNNDEFGFSLKFLTKICIRNR